MTSVSEEKWRFFDCSLVQGACGSPRVPDPGKRVSDQDTGSPSTRRPVQFILVCKCPVSRGIVVHKQYHPSW
jgi:hypothetical protein